ncbi:MAG: tetratricopeptide repeat protein [Deltaproteobacteria bacterium]|jgi:TolB-like protein/cytochrome c-type biogenesis protein CcmH/NrfG|nr:tetratricopeptide repeat protein [Deltaproteobacteria bacterium]
MEFFAQVATWISANEALLSGIAAMIVVAGVIFSPIGLGIRRLLGRSEDDQSASRAPESLAEPSPTAVPQSVDSRASTVPTDRPSIAVLPFVNMSDDTEQAFLADGMTEDIITGLAATRHLHVVARNSTFAYKGRSPDIRDVGRELGVRYVLEGSVRRVGEKMRTTVQLIEAATGNHLWAEKYDRLYADIFDVQDEVVSDIAGALSLQITQAEVSRARREPPAKLGAWELVQQAMHSNFHDGPSLERSRAVVDTLERAVELDSHYAYARAAYAWMLVSAAINGWAEDHLETFAEGQSQLRAALDLDTSDPLTKFYIGAAYGYTAQWHKSVRFLEQSLASNPHQPDAMVHLALAWGFLGDFDRSYEGFDRAERMASKEAHAGAYVWYRAIVLGLEGRYEEAIPILQDVVETMPRYATARVTLAMAYELTGHPEKARAAVERACELDPGLNVNGIAMNVGAHPDPERGRERQAILYKYWPSA